MVAARAILGEWLGGSGGGWQDSGGVWPGMKLIQGTFAAEGDPEAYRFPVAKLPGLDFSFSGLKTALLYAVRDLSPEELEARRADLAASYQRAIVESLALKVERALKQTGLEQLAIGGGVGANGPLRERLSGLEVTVDVPPRELCTDNAAMIASAARFVDVLPYPDYLGVDVYATGERMPVLR